MGGELYGFHRPILSIGQIFRLKAFKETQHERQALLVIIVLNQRCIESAAGCPADRAC
jgi:hypothetical protein